MQALHERYEQEIVSALQEKFDIKNVMAVPRLDKVCCNVGLGYDGIADAKVLDYVKGDLALMTGQLPVITKARKAVSNFKIRRGMPIGCRVTLRRKMMYSFVDKLINVVIPRVRDFRGIPAESFDRAGNFALGLREHVIFPEIDIENVNYNFGMDIVFVILNGGNGRSYELLKLFGVPFREDRQEAE